MRSELRRRAVKWGWHSAHFSLARGRNSQATPSLLCVGSDVLNDEVTPRAFAPVGRLPDLAVNAMSVEVLNFAMDISVAPTTHT